MAKREYNGINFPEGFKQTFKEFESCCLNMEMFKNIPEKDRQTEINKAYTIATGKNPPKSKTNGNVSGSTANSPKTDTEENS